MKKRKSAAAGSLTVPVIALILVSLVLSLVQLCHDGWSNDLMLYCAIVLGLGAVLVIVMAVVWRRQWNRQAQEYCDEMEHLKTEQQEELSQVREAAKREGETFRSILSHSLRVPTAIVQGYAELLCSDMDLSEETRREYLEKIVQRSRGMADTIGRHLAVETEPKCGEMELSLAEVDLLALITQAADDIRVAAEERGISIQIVSTEESIPAMADGTLLDRVIFNLLENALKYMGRPGVITIRVLKDREKVSILIQDDGLGLPVEETEHVFEYRFQGSNHISGSGYGLFLVKQTVEAHGGTVSAASSPGRGMGVTVTLPLCPVEAVVG